MRTKTLKKFDIENPKVPDHILKNALGSGGFPYNKKIKRKLYENDLIPLQLELLKLQAEVERIGERIIILFEGRDTSGKGGAISTIMQRLNPRHARSVALSKPSDYEKGQWYFQRYVDHLPSRGEITLFDRSWYNRAGVEHVMGFCSPQQYADFLRDVPDFENLLIRGGIRVLKFYLFVGKEMQLLRFHERKHDPLKQWKLTDIDLAAMKKWDEYSDAEIQMLRFSNTQSCPWFIVRANDQRRMRLEIIRKILSNFEYKGKDTEVIHTPDPLIVLDANKFIEEREAVYFPRHSSRH